MINHLNELGSICRLSQTQRELPSDVWEKMSSTPPKVQETMCLILIACTLLSIVVTVLFLCWKTNCCKNSCNSCKRERTKWSSLKQLKSRRLRGSCCRKRELLPVRHLGAEKGSSCKLDKGGTVGRGIKRRGCQKAYRDQERHLRMVARNHIKNRNREQVSNRQNYRTRRCLEAERQEFQRYRRQAHKQLFESANCANNHNVDTITIISEWYDDVVSNSL